MFQPVPKTLHLNFGGGTDLPRTLAGDRRAAPTMPTMRLSAQSTSNEADYCLARALVEVQRAEEAAHPAARDAHLQMAMLYRLEAGEILDCVS